MHRHLRAPAVITFLVLPLFAGCGPKTGADSALGPDAGGPSADRAAIRGLIETAPELDFAFTDDGGELLGEVAASTTTSGAELAAASEADSATLPVRWGRWRAPAGHPPVRTIEFLSGPDQERALVKINVKFDGLFLVDRTDDGVRNPGKKPLRDEVTRYALFRKIWFHLDPASPDSVHGWRLVAVSPSRFAMSDPAAQTVQIQSITFTGATARVTISDPAALLSLGRTPQALPVFQAGEAVRVEAAVTNSDAAFDPATFVFLHAPVLDRAFPGPGERMRIRMWDDGRHGDTAAGDGTFTAVWTVACTGRHHTAVDVINSRTLQNETEDDYNSTAWGIPYVAYPAFLP